MFVSGQPRIVVLPSSVREYTQARDEETSEKMAAQRRDQCYLSGLEEGLGAADKRSSALGMAVDSNVGFNAEMLCFYGLVGSMVFKSPTYCFRKHQARLLPTNTVNTNRKCESNMVSSGSRFVLVHHFFANTLTELHFQQTL